MAQGFLIGRLFFYSVNKKMIKNESNAQIGMQCSQFFLGGGGYSGHNWNKDFIKIKLYGSKQRLCGQTMTLAKGQLRCSIWDAAAAAAAAPPL